MDIATALGASVVSLNTTALLLLFYAIRPFDADTRKERRLLNLKRIRIGTFVVVTLGQAGLGAWRAIQGRFMLAMYDAQLVSTGILWALTAGSMAVVWPRQAGVSVLPVVLVSLAVVGLLMATDCLHDTTQDFTHDDRIAGVSLHTVELAALLFVCMAEALYGHFASLPLSELEEPLFDKTDKEKAKEAEKRAAKKRSATRAQRTARAFRYVWPESRPLRLRLVACFMLVMAERCVNLAVPVLYKNMVDELSGTATPDGGDGGAGGGGGLAAAARTLAGAAMRVVAAGGNGTRVDGSVAAAAAVAAGGSGAVELEVDAEVQVQLVKAAYGLLKAAQQLSFWGVFYPWVFAYLGFYFLRGGSGMEGLLANMRDLVWIPITQAAFRRISLDVFGHLLDLDHAFHLHRKTGQIMRILDRGTSSIQDTVSIVLFNVIPQLIDIVVACTYLALKMQPWAAVIVFITVASYVPLTVIITERRGVIRKRMNALDNAREGRATDMLLNYETVKYFCNEKFELAGYDNATRQYQAAEYWQMAFLAMLSITQASVVWFGLATGMVVCVRGVVRGSLTVGDAVLFVTMMNQLYVPLTFFGSYYRQVQKALIDMENMFELLDTEPSVRDSPGAGQLRVGPARVDFERVVFGYTASSLPVLKGVTFAVPGGKTLAVVGATGSGKSTILRLLLRFYDPLSGRVLLDGQDIKMVSQESLRRAVAVVPQDTVMFNDTVMYNIRYGRTDATDEEVTEAAAVAHIHASITTTFKKGYATRVGERGLRLSGGEKQRVAFARAVLKRPSVLILDEATSALDSLTELAIQSSLQTLRSRCTTVIVAHRLSTIMDADLILVLDRGEVAQCGCHSELMEEGGLYAAMWSRQQDTAGYSTPIIGLHSGGGAASLTSGHRTFSEPPPAPLLVAGAPSLASPLPSATPLNLAVTPDRHTTTTITTTTTTTNNNNSAATIANSNAFITRMHAGGGGGAAAAAAAPRGAAPLPPHPPGFGPAAAAARHRRGDDALSPPPALPALPGRATGSGGGGGGGLPRVPSRLMRRAILSEEMSEAGEHGALSRNPTPSRRARALEEDEADERLYEDRDTEEQADGNGLTSPDLSKPPQPPAATTSTTTADGSVDGDVEAPPASASASARQALPKRDASFGSSGPGLGPGNGDVTPRGRLTGPMGQSQAAAAAAASPPASPLAQQAAAARLEQRSGSSGGGGGADSGKRSGGGAAAAASAFASPTAMAAAMFGSPLTPPDGGGAAASPAVTLARLRGRAGSGGSSGGGSSGLDTPSRALLAAHEEQERLLVQHRQEFIKRKDELTAPAAAAAAVLAGAAALRGRRRNGGSGSSPVQPASPTVSASGAGGGGSGGGGGGGGGGVAPEGMRRGDSDGSSSRGARRRDRDARPAAGVAMPPDEEV
ncbi:hypothetical protein PLESTB_001249100 [Pleodorina starrii]|uniref:Uncharacterized protein n=1 Tax=Pleodorina starrii TaxID=330485 RepID=A0A9W6F5W4_9CHLO|nr:hypothetical protein PLESTM_000210900 [Pleodorina starrii]GLC57642.1 hypothetical protein PLESTB_001249100 [Pleodorina starrii]